MRECHFGFLCAIVLLWLSGCEDGVFADPAKKTKEEISAEDKERRQIEALLAAKSDVDFERAINNLAHSGEPMAVTVMLKAMLQIPPEPQKMPAGQSEGRKSRLARELRFILPSPNFQSLLDRYFRAISQGADAVKVAEERLCKWIEQNKNFLEWDPYLLRFDLRPQRQPGTFGR